jgi:kinesin family protein 1
LKYKPSVQITLSQEPDPEEDIPNVKTERIENKDGFKYISETRVIPRR